MIQAKVEITGLEKALSQLSAYDKGVNNLSKPLQQAGEFLLDFFSNEVYRSEGAAYGSPWVPLSPRYAQQKLKRWGQQPILIASGKMSKSYSLKVASDYLIIQNDAKNSDGQYYAGYHQEGGRKLPQRKVMKFQKQQLDKVAEIVVQYINNILKNSLI